VFRSSVEVGLLRGSFSVAVFIGGIQLESRP